MKFRPSARTILTSFIWTGAKGVKEDRKRELRELFPSPLGSRVALMNFCQVFDSSAGVYLGNPLKLDHTSSKKRHLLEEYLNLKSDFFPI